MNRISFYINFFYKELCDKKWSFLLIAWIISLCGILVITLIPNQYKTKAGISIDTDRLLSQVVRSNTVSLEQSTRAQAQKVSQIIYSTENLLRVLRNVNQESYKLTRTEELLIVQRMQEDLSFVNVGRDYYELSYVHSDPQIAFDTLKEILNIFVETNIKKLSSTSDRAVVFSADTVKERQKEYAKMQKRYTDFQTENYELIDPNNIIITELRKAEKVIEDYSVQKKTLKRRISSRNALLAQTPKTLGTSQAPIDPNCDISGLLRERDSSLARGLTQSHPDIIYLNELIAARKLSCPQSFSGTQRASNPAYVQLLTDIQLEKDNLALLERNYREATNKLPTLQAKLERRPAVLEKLNTLLQQKNKAEKMLSQADFNNDRIQETIDLNRKTGLINYDIVQPVTFPVKPEKPNRLLLFIGAFLASLMASGGLIIMRVQMEQRMPTIYHLRDVFDLPILGSISQVQTATDNQVNVIDNMMWAGSLALLVIVYGILIYFFAILYAKPNFTIIYDTISSVMQILG